MNLCLWQFGRGKPALGGFWWQTQRIVRLSSNQNVIGVLLRRARAAQVTRPSTRLQSLVHCSNQGCKDIKSGFQLRLLQPPFSRDVVQPSVFGTATLNKKIDFTWSRVGPLLLPVNNQEKHKICASPITRNVGWRSWFKYEFLLSA